MSAAVMLGFRLRRSVVLCSLCLCAALPWASLAGPPGSPVLWLDANDLDGAGNGPAGDSAYYDGSQNVTGWRDKSGNGNHVTTVVGTPHYVSSSIGGLPAVQLDGLTEYLRTTTGGDALNTDFTMVAVVNLSALGSHRMILSAGEELQGRRRCMWKNANQKFSFNGLSADIEGTVTLATFTDYLVMITRSTGGTVNLYANNQPGGSGSPGLNSYTSGAITIGANNGGGERTGADYAEILVYDTQLSATDLDTVGFYLQDKYGFNLGYAGPNPRLSYSPTTVGETLANDGSVTESIAIALTNDTFTAGVVSGGHVTAANVPAGLTANFTRVSDTVVTLGFSGNATSHELANSVTNLTVAFADGAFVSNPAASVMRATNSTLAITFYSAFATPPGTGLRLWLDGDDVDGDRRSEGATESYIKGIVATWADKSGNHNDFVCTSFYPDRTLDVRNGRDGLLFNGTNDRLSKNGGVLTAGDDTYTYFAVWRPSKSSGLQRVFEQYRRDVTSAYAAILAYDGRYGFNGQSNDAHWLVPFVHDVWRLTDMVVDNAQQNNIDLADNGTHYLGRTSDPATLNLGDHYCTIGAKNNGDSGELLQGELMELLVYDSALSASERITVGAYLERKYAFSFGYRASIAALSYTPSTLYETEANDGSVAGTITITLANDTFAGNVVSGGHVTAANVPAGLTANFTRVSDTVITLSFGSTATSHVAADSIDDLTVTFDNGAFTANPASEVVDATYNSLNIHFDDALPPAPIHLWTFNDGTADDSVGTAHGTLYGTATIVHGRLRLTGSAASNRVETLAFGHTLDEKTLVAWCTLQDHTVNSAGGPLSVYASSVFDAIVYGERAPNQWMNGSERWNRTPANNGGDPETLDEPGVIMIAIAYAKDRSVTIYRNGTIYASVAQGALVHFGANVVALMGPREGSGSNYSGYFNGYVDEARVYDVALRPSHIAALAAQGPQAMPPTGTALILR